MAVDELAGIKRLLKHAESLSEAMVAKLAENNPRRPPSGGRNTSYSADELKRIADAARADVHGAAVRIRRNREILDRFRRGELAAEDRRLELLDWVDRFGDVPASPAPTARRAATSYRVGYGRTLRSTTSSASSTCPVWRSPLPSCC